MIRGFIQWIKDKYYGYTGITGLNQMQNNLTMLILVLGSFLPLWFGALYLAAYLVTVLPEELMWLSGAIQIAALIGEVVIFVLAHAFVRVDATKYKAAPQTTLFMPDGGEPKYTLKIAEEGIREICEFKDGGVGVHLPLKDRYRYDDRRFPLPIIFRELYLKIPAKLGESFDFMRLGEYWHQGMVVTTGTCENMSIYIRDYPEDHGRFKPVGVVGDCTFQHKRFMNDGELAEKGQIERPTLSENEAYKILYYAKKQEYDRLFQHSETVEDVNVALREEQGKGVKKQVDDTISAARERVHLITDTKPPLSSRLKNLPWAWIIGGTIIILILAKFVFGWI